jgi:hypothetical protein
MVSEESYPMFAGVSNLVLGFLYDVRHTYHGDRDIVIDFTAKATLKEHGIEDDRDAVFVFTMPWYWTTFVVCALELYKNISMNDHRYRNAHYDGYMDMEDEDVKEMYQTNKKKEYIIVP